MDTIEDLLRDLQDAELTWAPSKDEHAMYDAVYKGKPIKLRVNDFPDEIAITVIAGGKTFDLEERPKGWHFATRKNGPAAHPSVSRSE